MSMIHSQLALLRDVLGQGHRTHEHHLQNEASADFAKRIYETRRIRDHFFPDTLFADPAWDILLDLFIARRSHRKICVSSACVGACVPATTALRWLERLQQSGLIERMSNSGDGRSIFVRLTDEADDRMTALLDQISTRLLAGHDASKTGTYSAQSSISLSRPDRA